MKKRFFYLMLFILCFFLVSCSGTISFSGEGDGITLTIEAYSHGISYCPNYLRVYVNGTLAMDWFFEDTKTISVNSGDVISAVIRYDDSWSSELDCTFNSGYGGPKTYTIYESKIFEFQYDATMQEK